MEVSQPSPRQRVVRRLDDAGCTRLRREPKEDSAFVIDGVDRGETQVADGATVTVLSSDGEFSRIITVDQREGYILASYLAEERTTPQDQRGAMEEHIMPWERAVTRTEPIETIPLAAGHIGSEQPLPGDVQPTLAAALKQTSAVTATVAETEDPDDDAMEHREITRDHLVAMAEAIGLDDELLDSMVDALDGDLQSTAGMLHEQGAPDPWAAFEVKWEKAGAAQLNAQNATSVATAMPRNVDADRLKVADAEAEDDIEILADKYLAPARWLPEATPPTPPMVVGRSSKEELMAMKPSHLVKRAIAVGVDQTALETAQDGQQPRSDIVSLIISATTQSNADVSASAEIPDAAAKASLFGAAAASPNGRRLQQEATVGNDDERSALFAGSKRPMDSMPSTATLSLGGGTRLGPSAQVLEAQQRVRQNLEHLGELSVRTKQMEDNSQEFASMAKQLRKKKQFGLF